MLRENNAGTLGFEDKLKVFENLETALPNAVAAAPTNLQLWGPRLQLHAHVCDQHMPTNGNTGKEGSLGHSMTPSYILKHSSDKLC